MREPIETAQVFDSTQTDQLSEILVQVVGPWKEKEERKVKKKRRKEKTNPTSLLDLDLCKLRTKDF